MVCNPDTAEPVWFGREGKKETLDEFFRSQLSIEQWAPQCKIVYDKFQILQHANDAIDKVRRAEFFRQGKKKRDLIKGKKWLRMSRWKHLTGAQRGEATLRHCEYHLADLLDWIVWATTGVALRSTSSVSI